MLRVQPHSLHANDPPFPASYLLYNLHLQGWRQVARSFGDGQPAVPCSLSNN